MSEIKNHKFTSPEEVRDALSEVEGLTDCDLEALDLTTVDLSGKTLSRCNLRSVRFGSARKVELYSCNLERAKLIGADFRWARAVNCRADRMDPLGLQTTFDCDFWSGLKSTSSPDIYLLLYWLTLPDNPLTREIAEKYIPKEVRLLLDQTFHREL